MTTASLDAVLASAFGAPLAEHAHMPDSVFEWVLFSVAAVVCAWLVWKAVRMTVRPGEQEPDHIKRSILDDEPPPPSPPSPPPP